MKTEKLSISLPRDAVRFIEEHRKAKSLKTRSEVVARAIALLRERVLEDEYQAAREENRRYVQEWESAAADGLAEDETW